MRLGLIKPAYLGRALLSSEWGFTGVSTKTGTRQRTPLN